MDIWEELESLYEKRSLQYMEKFESDNAIKDKLVEYLKSMLYENKAKYIIISPLYSSFVTCSYECRMGVYDYRLYVGSVDKAVYVSVPLINTYIQDDIEYIKNILIADDKIEVHEKKDIEYSYSLKYMELIRVIWKNTVMQLYSCLKESHEEYLLEGVKILFGLYMEQSEELFVGGNNE